MLEQIDKPSNTISVSENNFTIPNTTSVNQTTPIISYNTSDTMYKLPEIPIKHQYNPLPIVKTSQCSNNLSIISDDNIINNEPDTKFLLVCIGMLILTLIVVGFVGYWVLYKHDNYNNNKSNKKFLMNFLYGIGITILLVVLFLCYLIVCH